MCSVLISANVTLKLKGEKITSSEFKKSIESFFGLIGEVAKDVGGKGEFIQWFITVDKGSSLIVATPQETGGKPGIGGEICKAINSGIKIIESRGIRPPCFNDNALQNIQKLASNIKTNEEDIGIEHIFISTNGSSNEITYRTVANAKNVLEKSSSVAYGSIEGRLQAINGRHGLLFRVYDDFSDRPVTCYFKEDLLGDVIKAFQKRVSVYGEIKYGKAGEPISIKVKKFRIFGERAELPQFDDLIGIFED